MKRELPIFLTGLTGLILIAHYYITIPIPFINRLAEAMPNWGVIIAAFTLALAAANLIKIHLTRLIRGGGIGRVLPSVVLLAGLFVTAISGIFLGQSSTSFNFIFTNMYTPLAAAFYAMTAFHLASASYRAFRARTAQAAVLLVTGVLLMLGRAPIGEAVWAQFPTIANWIMNVGNLAGSRGIMISIAVGVIGVSLRVLVGIDRAHLGAE